MFSTISLNSFTKMQWRKVFTTKTKIAPTCRTTLWTANIHGETSELWEAARKGQLLDTCDKKCGLTCEEEELADIIIRALDTACARNINIGRAVLTKHEYNTTRSHKHGGKLA